ncbi:hypothetical protein BGY98DRAFT_156449 [Russula aff. rugulosa BPL654]|nr:hypothetical protein BGY98DRAFT_156449 [Russula aff. rugulosa BPL654]
MVNFQNPITFAREFAATVNLWHTTDGIFIWEFFTTLDYEWNVIRGHEPYRWTIWVYSIARVSTLMAIALNMLGYDDDGRLSCQAWATINVFFAYASFGSASLLIVLRIIAIWNKDTIIVLTAMGLWLANVSFLIYGTAAIRCVWSDENHSCVLLNPQSNKLNVVVSLVSDTLLLLIMLVGLLRLRFQATKFGLGRILWNQSLVWLALATVAEVPPTVFMFLNLNEALDLMFQGPNMVIMSIAATRMYRSLINLGTTEVSDGVLGGTSTVSKIRFHFKSVPLERMTSRVPSQTDGELGEEHSTPQSEGGGTDTRADPQEDKASLNRDVDVE